MESLRQTEEHLHWKEYISRWFDADQRTEYLRAMDQKNVDSLDLHVLLNLTFGDCQLEKGSTLTKRLIELGIH